MSSSLDLFKKELNSEIEISRSYLLSGACLNMEDYKTHTSRIRALQDAMTILISSIKITTERTDED